MWTYDPAERHAILAHKSLKKKFSVKRLQVIVEIACASSPYHLIAVRKAYCSLFDCSLEEDIVSIVPFALRKVTITYSKSHKIPAFINMDFSYSFV